MTAAKLSLLPGAPIEERISGCDWPRIGRDLGDRGHAVIDGLLSAPEMHARSIALYDVADLYRSRVVMARHGYGRGEYQYFSYPLPELVARLRTSLYPHLAPVANRWHEATGARGPLSR